MDTIRSIIRENTLYALKHEFEISDNKDRQKLLQKAIDELEDNLSKQDKRSQSEKFTDNLDKTAKLMYKQPWLRLQQFQREDKIKEYIEDKYKNDKNRTDILKFYLDANKDGKLKTAHKVIYDIQNCKITEIKLKYSE